MSDELRQLRQDFQAARAQLDVLERRLAALEQQGNVQVSELPQQQSLIVETPHLEDGTVDVVEESVNDDAPHSADVVLCDALEALAALIRDRGVGMDPAHTGFMGKVRAILLVASGGDRLARLTDILRFCDTMGAAYLGRSYGPLQQQLQQIRTLVQECFATDAQLVQLSGPDGSHVQKALPMSAPLVLSTGLSRNGEVVVPAQSLGVMENPNRLQSAIWMLVEECYESLIRSFQPAIKKLADQLTAAVHTITDSSESADALRGLLNDHTRVLEKHDTAGTKAVLAILHDWIGLRDVVLQPGQRFDPVIHSDKQYDCSTRPSSEAQGTVLAVRQIGFVGSDGLPVQRCLVVCS